MASKIAAQSQKRKEGFLRDLHTPDANREKLERLQAAIGKVVLLPIEEILIEDNVRQSIDTEADSFLELVSSIQENKGVLQNLIIELQINDDKYRLICIAGQRRLLAARIAGVVKVPALIKQYANDGERVIDGLTENLTRQDLPAIDIAEGYQRLLKAGITEQMISARFDRQGRTVRKYLAISKYPADVRSTLRKNPNIFTTRVIFNQLASRTFPSNDALRAAVQAILNNQSRQKTNKIGAQKDGNFGQTTAARIKQRLNLKTTVKGDQNQGFVKVTYTSAEELKLLLTQLEK
jgi:ParB family chromosome partitioning protein